MLLWQLDLTRVVSREEAETYCSTNGALNYTETSAKDATGVEEAFTACLKRWAAQDRPQVSHRNVVGDLFEDSCSVISNF